MNSTTAAQTPDFWLTSGWHLCDHGPEGGLMPSADFMLAYFHRPEPVSYTHLTLPTTPYV